MRRFALSLILGISLLASGLLYSAHEAQPQSIPAYVNVSPADQAAITTTSRMLGLAAIANQGGCVIRPQTSGRVTVHMTFQLVNNTAGDGGRVQLAWGPASTAAANGAALPGSWTAVGTAKGSGNGATTEEMGSLSWVVAGLTPGTLYGFDLLVTIVTGGNETVSKLDCSMIEG